MALPPLTLLVITPLSGDDAFELLPYSARGLTQTLEPISQGNQVFYDINGNVMDWSLPQFQKYSSRITCRDSDAPAFDGAWFGKIVQVDCAIELRYRTGAIQQRTEVPGSIRTEGAFTYYRPRLIMRVNEIRNSFEEWGAMYSWSIGLLETAT